MRMAASANASFWRSTSFLSLLMSFLSSVFSVRRLVCLSSMMLVNSCSHKGRCSECSPRCLSHSPRLSSETVRLSSKRDSFSPGRRCAGVSPSHPSRLNVPALYCPIQLVMVTALTPLSRATSLTLRPLPSCIFLTTAARNPIEYFI